MDILRSSILLGRQVRVAALRPKKVIFETGLTFFIKVSLFVLKSQSHSTIFCPEVRKADQYAAKLS